MPAPAPARGQTNVLRLEMVHCVPVLLWGGLEEPAGPWPSGEDAIILSTKQIDFLVFPSSDHTRLRRAGALGCVTVEL